MKLLMNFLHAVLLTVFAASHASAISENPQSISIGVVPYQSPRALVELFEPFRAYLEQTLSTPVHVYSAPGFNQYFQNTRKGEYDITISPAHFARLQQKELQHTPLARFKKNVRSLILTAKNSKLTSPQDLLGKTIAVPDQLALASIVCLNWLQEKGLRAGSDFKILEVPTFGSAIVALKNNQADAACSASAVLRYMNTETKESVRTLVDAGEYVNVVVLAHPRLGKQKISAIQQALFKFGSTSSDNQFLTTIGFGNLIPATHDDMRSLDRYLDITQKLLNSSN